MRLDTAIKLIVVMGLIWLGYQQDKIKTWESFFAIILVLIWIELMEINKDKEDTK